MALSVDESAEVSPLLAASPPSVHSTSPSHHDSVHGRFAYRLALLVMFLIAGSNFLLIAPITQLKELAICKTYYGAIWTPESDCKAEPVQSALALLIGWQQLLDCIPAILLGIFYGSLADQYGRRPVLAMSLFGMSLGAAWIQVVLSWPEALPTKLIWLSSAFYLLGGGTIVGTCMVFVVVSDISSDEERASNIFRLNAMALLAEFFLPPLSSLLMHKSLWLPARLGLASIFISALLVSIALPETANFSKPIESSSSSLSENSQLDRDPDKNIWRDATAGLLSRIKDLRIIWKSPQLILLVAVFSVAPLYRSSSEFLLQYVSRRYGWQISEAGFLISYRAAVNFALLIVILPGLGVVIMKYGHRDAHTKDLWLLRASTISMAIGTLVIGLSPQASFMVIGLTLFALGHGLVPLLLSIATVLVDPAHIGMLYNVMAVSETVGTLINGPLLSNSFRAGMRAGGILTGLPFIISGVIFFLASIAVFAVRVPRGTLSDGIGRSNH